MVQSRAHVLMGSRLPVLLPIDLGQQPFVHVGPAFLQLFSTAHGVPSRNK
jgi:hypothetical protein